MAKKVEGMIKLQIPAGNATPAPPVGPALGQKGVNIMDFCKQFNAKTADQPGMIIPVVITVYADRSFTFVTKTPPAAVLLKKAANLKSASGERPFRSLFTFRNYQKVVRSFSYLYNCSLGISGHVLRFNSQLIDCISY